MNDMINPEAVNRELAKTDPAGEKIRRPGLSEIAELHRTEIKRRIREAHQSAATEIEQITAQLAEIDRAIELHQANKLGLEDLLAEAKERLLQAKFSMARYV